MKDRHSVYAIYSRKSRFTGKGESIGNQVEMCREYLRLHFGEEAAASALVYEDEGFSGGNLQRPAFKKLMEAARRQSFRAVVVYRLDRISRNIGDFSGLVEELKHLDIGFISIREQFDTTTPTGRAMMYISSVFSQLERETIAERIRDNMHELAKTGRWLGGTTPIGFRSESIQKVTPDGKARKAFRLSLIPQEAELVRSIFQLFLSGRSLTMTEAALLDQGVSTRNGVPFSRFAVRGILQNPVYAAADAETLAYIKQNEGELFCSETAFDGSHGLMVYNRTAQEKGRTAKLLPISAWIITVGEHPALINGKEWVAAQKLLDENRTKAFRRPRSNQALLTGLLFCRCGSRMYPKVTSRSTADGDKVYFYMCRRKEQSRRTLCAQPNLNGNPADRAVLEQLRSIPEDRREFLHFLKKDRDFYVGDHADPAETLNRLRGEQAANAKKITELVDTMVGANEIVKQHIGRRIEELNHAAEQLGSRIRELESLAGRGGMDEAELERHKNRLSDLSTCVDSMSIEEKRNALRMLVRRVVWDGEAVHVILGTSD